MPDQTPVNYAIQQPDIGAAFARGLDTTLNIGKAQTGLQMQQLQMQQLQQQQQRATQMRTDLAALASNQNPTAQDYSRMVLQYPELKDSFKQSWDALSTERQSAKLQQIMPVYAAIRSGNNDLAVSLLQRNVDALKNSNGSAQDIQAAQTWLNLAQSSPDTLHDVGSLMLSSILPPGDFEKAFGTIQTQERENAAAPGKQIATVAGAAKDFATADQTRAKTPAEVAKLEAEAADIRNQMLNRGERLALDRDKLESETGIKLQELQQKYGQLPEDVRKSVDTASNNSIIATNSASQMRGLADQFAQANKGDWVNTGLGEKMAAYTGRQDYLSQLKQEYARIKNSEMLKALPPGPASDRDMDTARRGFLPENAPPEEIASWLRGMAKLQDYQAKYQDAQSQWYAANQHLGKLTKDVQIGDTRVAAGTTFKDYITQILKSPGAQTQPGGNKTNYMEKYGK